MNLNGEEFREIYKDFKKGNFNNLYIIMDNSLYLVINELKNYDINDYLIRDSILFLVKAIMNYSYEKATTIDIFISKYIKLRIHQNDDIVENDILDDEILFKYILEVKNNLIQECSIKTFSKK